MADELGKKLERKLKEDFLKMGGATIDRLYDPVSGFHGICNVCDFIGYKFPFICYMECKTTKGNTFPLSRLTQYDSLIKKKGIKGVIAGVVIWFYDNDKIVFVPIDTIEKLLSDGEKSVNIRKFLNSEEEYAYNILELPSVKKRTFFDTDYTALLKYYEENLKDE